MRLRLLRASVGLVISAAALAIALSRADLAAVGQALAAASPVLVLLVVLATCVDIACRTIRWRAILAPVRTVAFVRALAYILVGYLGNNVLPARLGELVRSHYAGDRERISRATILGTIIAERVVDTVVLALIAAGAVIALGIHGAIAFAIVAGLGLALALAIALAAVVAIERLPWLHRANGELGAMRRIGALATRLRRGASVVADPRTLVQALVWSLAAWLATIVGFMCAALAVGVHPTWSQIALIASGTALATAIPAGPGYIGTFELAGVQIAAALNIDPDHSLALVVLAHLSAIAVTSVGGAIALVWLANGSRDSNAGRVADRP